MPNYVTTRITGPAGIVAAMTRRHTEAERLDHDAAEAKWRQRLVDLGRADEYQYRPLDMGEVLVDFGMLVPQPDNLERGACNGRHEDGVVCWHHWNLQNWGTKWNGGELAIESSGPDTEQLRFDTAWSHPRPIIEVLSRKFPEDPLEVSYADEDLGHNLGHYVIVGGEIAHETDFVLGGTVACDFASRLRHDLAYDELMAEIGQDD